MWNTDLLDTYLDLFDTDNSSNHFVCLQDVLKTSSRHVFKTSSVSQFFIFQDVLKTSWRHALKTSWRRLKDQQMFAGKGLFSGLRQFLTIENRFNVMKNAFYFMLKTLFVLEIFTFLFWIVGYVKGGLIRRLWLISNFMTAQIGQQIITIHIVPNISRNKGNQAMKFGQLIKYSVKNIFLQKLCRKWGKETSSRPLFLTKSFI